MVFLKFILVLVLTVCLTPSNGRAEDRPVQKLGRGIANIVTSPVEVVKQTRSYWIQGSAKTFHISAWLFCGVVYGGVMTIARIVSGAWDIATFPISQPKGYQPMLKPDYVFQEWPQRQPGVAYKQLGDK